MERKREGRGRREERGRGGKMRKIIGGGIILLLISIVIMSCGSGGPGEQGQATKSDGTVIDLKVVSKKIKDAVAVLASVKEIETLVKSIDELAKAIGKKIKNDGTLENETDKNGALIAGVHSVVSSVKTKVEALETRSEISNELRTKITEVKTKAGAFLNKLKEKSSDLGKNDVKDTDAKSAILITDSTKDKGASELIELNTVINTLVTASNSVLSSAILELTESSVKMVKPSNNN
ncbi:Variable outer membrane protein (plasmid) [Borrelia crocidurae DOU]|uniref:Variable outer membrane protein n=1 Tax=Borrelia crocidurae DOU TaxID=1293575 RepID=W5SKK2_9SPIR|nr:Vsp/OspC family lipoprotein [Borrelia crocidurae]AHH07193.1 Variable outer membrane protein [Borrelia crocidurae DOU]